MSRKTGSVPEETRAAILKAAAEEFSSLGFEKASLRSICKNANVTTGAMYGMFRDKEELFANVVSPITDGVIARITEHYKNENSIGFDDLSESQREDLRAAKEIIDIYYENKTVFDIILKNREHKCIEEFFDKLVEMTGDQTRQLVDLLPDEYKGKENFNECTIHWLSHLLVESLEHIISHDYPKERAYEQFKIMLQFMNGGFWSLAK